LVFDPFGGSGTTALESVRMGRRALSVDANPLASLIGQVKTTRVDKSTLADLHAIRTSLLAHLMILPKDSASTLKKYAAFVPEIPNREKWFPDSSCGELALIKSCIRGMESERATRIALLALSRTVLKVSFQDSETRYASRPREIAVGETVRNYLTELDGVVERVIRTAADLRYGVVQFVTADARELSRSDFPDESVDLVVTSPPYGNAFDYHLYHRFRLLWLGHDPRELASVEIGSHLRHQRSHNGFDAYLHDLAPCLQAIARLLKPGRYAALVVGDPRYDGKTHPGAESVADVARQSDLEPVCIIRRPIHRTKRSVVIAGRRASQEKILVLRKAPAHRSWVLEPPPYRLWAYEVDLRQRETAVMLGAQPSATGKTGGLKVEVDPYVALRAGRLTFSHAVLSMTGFRQATWQSILENGLAAAKSSRKDPKYVTHGLHGYKGKFYPQLAKGLINLAGLSSGSIVLDPFCGSGTTLLECYLNGLRPFGCDMHPLAAKIARAKVGILELSPDVVSEAVYALLAKLDAAPGTFPEQTDQFGERAIDEIRRWFAVPVVRKLNWLLRAIRSVSAGTLRDFLEVVLSSIVRDVSQQDPSDLRIRRRKEPLKDADVLGQFRDSLMVQYERIEKFWSVRGYCPYRFFPGAVGQGDSRDPSTFGNLGLEVGTVDFILTSPPYATALPYIDTDRLSLLLLLGMDSSQRRPLEEGLTGSREIRPADRRSLEEEIASCAHLPDDIGRFLKSIYERNCRDNVGFRRRNLPALLLRFFRDMRIILHNCSQVMRPGAEAMIVLGDSHTCVDGKDRLIPTTEFTELLGLSVGLRKVERIPITVTTDNHKHIRHAITENAVIRLKRPDPQ
jgi:DNA modification methylase